MTEGRKRAAETLVRRIENKELFSAAELRSAWGIPQAEIDDAVVDNRLFAFIDTDGEHYFPGFFAGGQHGVVDVLLAELDLNKLPLPSRQRRRSTRLLTG